MKIFGVLVLLAAIGCGDESTTGAPPILEAGDAGSIAADCPELWYSQACLMTGGAGPATGNSNQRKDEHGFPMNQCFTPSTTANPYGVAVDCIAMSAVSGLARCVVTCPGPGL